MEELDLSLEDWGEVPRDLHFQDHDCRTANPLLSAATRFWRACIGPHRNYNYGNTINTPKQSGSNDISKEFGTYQLDLGDEPHTDQTGVGKNESKKQVRTHTQSIMEVS